MLMCVSVCVRVCVFVLVCMGVCVCILCPLCVPLLLCAYVFNYLCVHVCAWMRVRRAPFCAHMCVGIETICSHNFNFYCNNFIYFLTKKSFIQFPRIHHFYTNGEKRCWNIWHLWLRVMCGVDYGIRCQKRTKKLHVKTSTSTQTANTYKYTYIVAPRPAHANVLQTYIAHKYAYIHTIFSLVKWRLRQMVCVVWVESFSGERLNGKVEPSQLNCCRRCSHGISVPIHTKDILENKKPAQSRKQF